MSVSRVLASTRRRAAAADTRMHSWMAFMLDQKQPFVLTCTSRRPKLAHARHTQQALASMPETMVHSRMCMLLPREIALTTCALHMRRGNGLLEDSRPSADRKPRKEEAHTSPIKESSTESHIQADDGPLKERGCLRGVHDLTTASMIRQESC